MKTQLAHLLLIVALMGCTAPTGDPVIINAEKSTAAAVEIFDTFLKFEFDNRAALSSWPQVHETAEHIRKYGPVLLTSARSITKAYKSSRTEANRVALTNAMVALDDAVTKANRAMNEVKTPATP